MFYKSNSALGYLQYAYILKLSSTEFVCCNNPDCYGSAYEVGLVKDYSDYHLEKVTELEFKSNSYIHSSLLDYLIKKSKENK